MRLKIRPFDHLTKEITFLLLSKKYRSISKLKTALERKRKLAGFEKFDSQWSSWGIPHPKGKK